MTEFEAVNLGVKGLQESIRQKSGGKLRGASRLVGRHEVTEYWVFREANVELEPGEALVVLSDETPQSTDFLRVAAGILPADEGTSHTTGRSLLVNPPRPKILRALSVGQSVRMLSGFYGMTDTEVDENFTAICRMARVHKILNEPIEEQDRNVRFQIAFSAAACAPVDLLCFDRMTWVGDEEFREACAPILRDLQAQGKTLIMAGASPPIARAIGTKGILLDEENTETLTIEETFQHLRGERRTRRQNRRRVRRELREFDDDASEF